MILSVPEIKFICENTSDVDQEGKRRKKMIIRDDICFSLIDDVVDRYDSQVELLRKNQFFIPKFSDKYLETEFQELLASVFKSEISDLCITEYVNNLEKKLIDFNTEQRVLVPLAGIQLNVKQVNCGVISLLQGGNNLLNSVMESINSVLKKSQNTKEEKEQANQHCHQFLARGLMLSAVAQYIVIAEPTRAKERALDETRRVLDVLRYSIPALYSKDKKVSISIANEEISSIRSLPILSTDGSKFSIESDRIGMLFPFIIDDERIKSFEQLGIKVLFDLLAKSYNSLSPFEKVLLNSIHWFASSTTQLEMENQLLNLLISLESLLTPKGNNPIGTAIAEGVAWIIGNEVESRRRIKKKVKNLYRTRSGVAHGGIKSVQESEVDELTSICGNLLATLIQRHAEFKSQDSLLEWIEERKLS